MFVFGSGVLIGTPAGGGTPVNLGLIQEATLDLSVSLKELYGQYNYPVAIGAGERKITVKSKMAKISGLALATLFFGVTPSVGQSMSQYGEAKTVPAVSTYTVTATNAATFQADLGVVYAATGLPLKLVTSLTAAGQYMVNTATGVYTFYSADASAAVLINYQYGVAATGQKFTASQQLLGSTINFSSTLFAQDPTTGNQFSVTALNCVASKLGLGTKLTDFMIPDFEFSCFANAAGNALNFNFGDAA